MFFHTFSRPSHRSLLARYEEGKLNTSDQIRFMEIFAGCARCREAVRQFDETRQSGAAGTEPPVSSTTFQPAVETLFRMHRDRVFQRRLLPPEPVTPRFALFPQPVMRYAMAAAMMLVIGLALISFRDSNPGPQIPAVPGESTVITANRPSGTVTGGPAIAETRPAPVSVQSAPRLAPAAPVAVKKTAVVRTRQPIAPPSDAQGVVIDSAKIVTMINYLSGNLPVERRVGLDFHPGGRPDAVDLTLILNLSVGNDSLEQMLAPKKGAAPHSPARTTL